MITITAAGRLVKDAELRQAGSSQVCGFSVAADTGFGDKKQAHFFSCSLWGNQGAALAQHLKKGNQVTVTGEYSEREYDGKQYKELRVNQIELQGGNQSQDSQQGGYQQQQQQQQNNQGYQQPSNNQQAPSNYAQQQANKAQGMQGQVNNQFAQQNQAHQDNYTQNGGGAVDDSIPF